MYLHETKNRTAKVQGIVFLTSANYFSLDIPFTQDGKKKGHGIYNGDCQAQLYKRYIKSVHIGQQK